MGDQVMGEQPSQPISAYLLGCDQLNAIIQRNSWARKRASSELVPGNGFLGSGEPDSAPLFGHPTGPPPTT